MSDRGVNSITQARRPPRGQFAYLGGVCIEDSRINIDAGIAVAAHSNVTTKLRRMVANKRPLADSPPLYSNHLVRNADLTHAVSNQPAEWLLISIGEVGNVRR